MPFRPVPHSSPAHGAWRRLALTVVALGLLVPDHASAAGCWRPPVDAPVVDPFRTPRCPWCPGNRGIEFGTAPGQRVVAVAAGRVTFAGLVAGVRYVVVAHADGDRVTYGNLRSPLVSTGDLVVAGMLLGRTAGRFHFGLRAGEHYVDPAPHLGRPVRRARLIPTDGSPPNPGSSPSLRCARS